MKVHEREGKDNWGKRRDFFRWWWCWFCGGGEGGGGVGGFGWGV